MQHKSTLPLPAVLYRFEIRKARKDVGAEYKASILDNRKEVKTDREKMHKSQIQY